MAPVNESDLEWTDYEDGDATFRRKQLGEAAEGEEIGCSLYELPPGGRAWPYHYHTANEEAIYVLAGTGTLRLDGESYSLNEGDYAAFPADESGGHRVVNDSDGPLRYLTLSTMAEPDVTIYPEMNKLGVYVGAPPGSRDERSHQGYYDLDETVDYWDD